MPACPAAGSLEGNGFGSPFVVRAERFALLREDAADDRHECPEHSKPRELPLEQELPPELLNHPRYRNRAEARCRRDGSVYLAHHRVMDRPVALKVIRGDLLDNASLVERFRREVKSAARLSLHPNIVAAYDAEQAGDSHFLVMEFVDGVNLGHLVKSRGPLPYELPAMRSGRPRKDWSMPFSAAWCIAISSRRI